MLKLLLVVAFLANVFFIAFCRAPKCGRNEVVSNCTNGGCQAKNCSQLGLPIPCIKLDPASCKKGCLCADGYLRADNGTCVLTKQCPKNCLRSNEVWDPCPPSCPPQTCESINQTYNCPLQPQPCEGACRCKPGYYRNKIGNCISREDCLKCTGPHEYFSCGGACDNVCATLSEQNQTNCPIVNVVCNNMCYCESDYARDENNICVPIKECKQAANNSTTKPPVDPPATVPTNCSDAQQRLEQGNDAFTSNFFFEVVQSNNGKSVIMSAYSVLFPLAQLTLYAEGPSYTELINVLNLNDKSEIRCTFPKMIKDYESQQQVEFSLAAKTYVNEQYELSDAFKEDSRIVFDAEAENIDFSNPYQAAATINAWVEAQTNNRIQDLVSPSMLSSLTRLVLTNAIYFKGNWVTQFNPNNTKERDFHVNSNTTIQIKIMNQRGRFRYAESRDLDAKILELPYKGGNFSFIAILPNAIEGLPQLVKKLQNPNALNSALDSLEYQTVEIFLPSLEITTQINLSDILQKLNVTKIFNPNTSGLTGILKNYEDLYVSAAIQKAFIVVNEVGSEAAAANAFVVSATSAVIEPPRVYIFNADHPFVYYILLRRVPLFSGAFIRP